MSNAAEDFAITRRAVDPRADGAVRTVHLSAGRVTIERTLEGVRMRLAVPTAAYRRLVISVRAGAGPSAERAELRLCHDDAELDVVIGVGAAEEVARSARAWSAVTGKAVSVEFGGIAMRSPRLRPLDARARARRRTAPMAERRLGRLGRFASRRKTGATERLAASFAGEREIIARS